MKVDVLNIQGESTGRQLDLPEDIFGVEPNDHVVYLAAKRYLANQRQGTSSSKERNAVKGSSRKIKRQKGTGTARAGDIKNPLFRGGGRVFGPEPREYNLRLNKKVRQLARKVVLSQKARDGKILIVEDFTFDQPKTKEFVGVLQRVNKEGNRSLFVTSEYDEVLYLSGRNVQGSKVINAVDLNTYAIMHAQTLILSESAVEKIVATLN